MFHRKPHRYRPTRDFDKDNHYARRRNSRQNYQTTNYQNGVEIASLRATDTLQRNIEHFLGDKGWYYDRRKNHYKNQGVQLIKSFQFRMLGRLSEL
ncbi:MAG: AIPR family protein [Acidobacteriia bacterium]|nr:AIPR family protein [Terriglobia bacterium]